MMRVLRERGWLLIAAMAIAVVLVFLLAPHAHGIDGGAWMAILPIFFAGVISSLSLLSPLGVVYLGRVPDSPVLPVSFQRPPPFRLT